jgi:glutamine---fructose-6-phosphate transaminase (isomerizing)
MSLWDEIGEQPAAVERSLRANRVAVRRVAGRLQEADFRYVLVAARGTSDNAARYAQYLWGARNRLLVALAAPSLFSGLERPPPLDGALVVGISQSGRSPDLVAVVQEARRQGRPSLVLTNDPDSPLAAAADLVLDLLVGPERAVAATKTYTAQLTLIAMLSAALAGDNEMLESLEAVPGHLAAVLEEAPGIRGIAQGRARLHRCVVLGRGYDLATAFEWALKLQELCAVVALPLSTADFEHGPVAMVESGFPVLAVAPRGSLHAGVHSLLGRLANERQADLVVISDAPETLALAGGRIALPDGLSEWMAPIAAAVGAQVFTYHLCLARGLDPDAPRGLRKVTRTR